MRTSNPTRRDVLLAPAALQAVLPADVPGGVGAIITDTLRRDPATVNTDWFGTVLIHGLMRWHARGVKEVRPFAEAWLKHHLDTPAVARYSGAKSRAVIAGGIHATTYAGHFGLSLPCSEIAVQFRNSATRRVCAEMAGIILHQTVRNHLGLVAHDDFADFAIPDTCFFVVESLIRAYRLDPNGGAAFRDQAVFQLRKYIETFLVQETGLAKTILKGRQLGQTYWTRASGWLLWAITGVLRSLEPAHPDFHRFTKQLEVLAAGVARVQDSSGGFHVLLNEPSTPLETTGTAMFASGLHEAMRKGWLPGAHAQTVGRAWEFVEQHITPDGKIRGAYCGWAVPAEERKIEGLMDSIEMGWIPGFILVTADELTTT